MNTRDGSGFRTSGYKTTERPHRPKAMDLMSAYQARYLAEEFGISLEQANTFVAQFGVERKVLFDRVKHALGR
jgi:hypothetical protein